MPGPTNFNPPFSVRHPLNNSPAVGVIGPNTRAFTSQGAMATQADVLIFAQPTLPTVAIGMWTVANRRTYVNGVATVGQSSNGIAMHIFVVPFPLPPVVVGPIYPTVGASRVHTR